MWQAVLPKNWTLMDLCRLLLHERSGANVEPCLTGSFLEQAIRSKEHIVPVMICFIVIRLNEVDGIPPLPDITGILNDAAVILDLPPEVCGYSNW